MSMVIPRRSERKYEPYPEYKDSGVEWLGEIPAHWEVWKVTHGFNKIGSGTTPQSTDLSYYDGDIPWVTTTELRETLINDTIAKLTAKALEEYSALNLYPEETLLIAMYGATIGRLGILNVPATVNQACCAFSEATQFCIKFFYYWLIYRRAILISLSAGGGQPNLSQDDLRSLRVPLPPTSEQQAIADFLDHETARIDELIVKKQSLMDLLQEQRTALIAHAVTRGLSPDAPMKDSGVEWLGEIPVHWGIKRLKYIIRKRITDGPHLTPEFVNEGIPFLSVDSIQDGELNFDSCRYISIADNNAFRAKALPEKGDILLGKAASTGKIAQVKVDYEFSIWSPLALIKPAKYIINPTYLEYSLKSTFLQSQIDVLCTHNTQNNISMDDIPILILPFPPIEEQQAIANFLDRETARIDRLVGRINQAVEKLQEYRTALITAAVIGKIDLR